MCLCLAYNLVDDIYIHASMQICRQNMSHIKHLNKFRCKSWVQVFQNFQQTFPSAVHLTFVFFYTLRLCVETLALRQPRRLSPTDTLDLVRVASPSGWTTCSVMGRSTTSPLVSTPSFKTTPGTANTMKMQECGAMVSQSIMQFLLLEVFQ